MKRRFVLAALASASVGCQQNPEVPTFSQPPVQLTMSLSTTALAIGRNDTIRVTAMNNLDQGVQLQFRTSCQIEVVIRNMQGTRVVPPVNRPVCLPLTSTLTWPANGSITQTFVWTGGLDYLPSDTQQKVPDGTYFVSATMDALGYSTFSPAIKMTVSGSAATTVTSAVLPDPSAR
jgi:hypothetical protein